MGSNRIKTSSSDYKSLHNMISLNITRKLILLDMAYSALLKTADWYSIDL